MGGDFTYMAAHMYFENLDKLIRYGLNSTFFKHFKYFKNLFGRIYKNTIYSVSMKCIILSLSLIFYDILVWGQWHSIHICQICF